MARLKGLLSYCLLLARGPGVNRPLWSKPLGPRVAPKVLQIPLSAASRPGDRPSQAGCLEPGFLLLKLNCPWFVGPFFQICDNKKWSGSFLCQQELRLKPQALMLTYLYFSIFLDSELHPTAPNSILPGPTLKGRRAGPTSSQPNENLSREMD